MELPLPASARDQGLADLRMLTIAAALFAGGLTIVFAAVAGFAHPGQPGVQAAATTSAQQPAGTSGEGDDQFAQAPAPTVPAQTNRQPSVVTGGSH